MRCQPPAADRRGLPRRCRLKRSCASLVIWLVAPTADPRAAAWQGLLHLDPAAAAGVMLKCPHRPSCPGPGGCRGCRPARLSGRRAKQAIQRRHKVPGSLLRQAVVRVERGRKGAAAVKRTSFCCVALQPEICLQSAHTVALHATCVCVWVPVQRLAKDDGVPQLAHWRWRRRATHWRADWSLQGLVDVPQKLAAA